MEAPGVLFRTSGNRSHSAGWLALSHADGGGSAAGALASLNLTAPVFLLQFTKPSLPVPALTVPESALPENVGTRPARFPFDPDVISSFRAVYEDPG